MRTVSTHGNNCEEGGGVEAGGKEEAEEAAVKQQSHLGQKNDHSLSDPLEGKKKRPTPETQSESLESRNWSVLHSE